MRIRLNDLDPRPDAHIKAIDNLAFMTALSDDYNEHGLGPDPDGRWTVIAKHYGSKRSDPGLTRADLTALLARDDLNAAEKHVLERAMEGLADVFSHYERTGEALTLHNMRSQLVDGSHRWRLH